MSESGGGEFQIRRATTDDAAALAAFLKDMFARTFGAQNKPEDLATYFAEAFGEEQQRREISNESIQFWIAESPDRPAGETECLLGCAQLKVGSLSRDVRAPRQAELGRLYADTRWHGRGVGHALLERCVSAATSWGARVLWLGVWENNPRAIAFYAKHGFRVVGEQSFQLGSDLQRDLVMARDLAAT